MESHVHLYLCYYKTAALRELSLMKAELVLETPLIRNKLMVTICVHLCLIHFGINTSGWKTLTVWEISVHVGLCNLVTLQKFLSSCENYIFTSISE